MRKYLHVCAIALTLSTGSAVAADLAATKAPPPPPPPPPLWTGFYLGLNIGGGWTDRSSDFNNPAFLAVAAQNPAVLTPFLGPFPVASPVANAILLASVDQRSSGGVVGGAQIGWNYQFQRSFVVGLETDIQGTSIGSDGGWWWGGAERLPWFGTVRGRVGFLFTPTLLAYGTGGFAYGEVRRPFAWWGWGNDNLRSGWTAGGGVEWLFLPNWSAKLEYLFVELDRNGNTGWFTGWDWGSHRRTQLNVVRVGVDWHWRAPSPAPVLAKY